MKSIISTVETVVQIFQISTFLFYLTLLFLGFSLCLVHAWNSVWSGGWLELTEILLLCFPKWRDFSHVWPLPVKSIFKCKYSWLGTTYHVRKQKAHVLKVRILELGTKAATYKELLWLGDLFWSLWSLGRGTAARTQGLTLANCTLHHSPPLPATSTFSNENDR